MNIGTLDRPSDSRTHPSSPAYVCDEARERDVSERAERYAELLGAVARLNAAAQACIAAGDVICPVPGYDHEDLMHGLSGARAPSVAAEDEQERREVG